jgi:integrase
LLNSGNAHNLLAEVGVTLPMIMERLGHKDEETTKSVYMYTTKAMKKKLLKSSVN